MRNKLSLTSVGMVLGLVAATPVLAQGMSLGEFEYRNSCAQCHGADGTGGGAVAAFLTSAPPDLTVLSRNNGGVFPVTAVYAVIDGSAQVGAHGRDMPLWGDRYMERLKQEQDFEFSPAERELYVRTRILSLIEYLSTLQAD